MPPVTLPVLLRRYWLQRLIMPLAWLIVLVVGWFMVGPRTGFVSQSLADLAVAGSLAVVGFLALTVLGALLGGLRLASLDVGVGQVLVKRYTRYGIVTLRWLPVSIRPYWTHNRSVRLPRLRLALPYVIPLIAFLAAAVALSSVPAVAQWAGPSRMTIRYAALGGLMVMVASLWVLSRMSSAQVAEECAPYVDGRVRVANRRFMGASYGGDRTRIRRYHEALLSVDPPALIRSVAEAEMAYAMGDFAAAAHQATRLTSRDGSVRYPSFLLLSVLAAREAGQAVDREFVDIARDASRQLFAKGASIESLLAAVARAAVLDGDVDTAIEWGEAAVRYQTDPRQRTEEMLLLAQCYASRGRATDAEKLLARCRRTEPNNPRLPHAARVVADHLAREAVALSHRSASAA